MEVASRGRDKIRVGVNIAGTLKSKLNVGVAYGRIPVDGRSPAASRSYGLARGVSP